MGILAEDMKRVVREQRLGYAATVSPDGTPNLSPKGTTAVWDDDHLVFADICSPGTMANLAKNPAIEINVVDPIVRRGYRFKGTATVLTEGMLFDQVMAFYRRQHGLPAGIADRVRHVVLVKVERALPLISPAYDDGTTERDVVRKWSAYYDTLRRSDGDAPSLSPGGSAMPAQAADDRFNQVHRHSALMDVIRNRMTNRVFASHDVPRSHYEMILEAARHAPSGANAQPWHYNVVTDPAIKARLGERFVQEQVQRARLGMKFPTPNYKGMKTAPGLIVVVADFRFVRAFPVFNDGSDLDRRYKVNAERILLQSVAASTMCAHLAAAALGYAVWWVSAIGQEEIQKEFKPILGVPDELSIIDIICFGPPQHPSYKRWKRRLNQIMSWDRFNTDNFLTDEQVDQWVRDMRAKVMYRDESRVD